GSHAHASPSNRLPASMLASNPVPSLNQNSQPLGIPYRFKTKQSRSSAAPPTPIERMWGEFAFKLELQEPEGAMLSLLTTTTVFGTAIDVALSELAIESFFPADEATREYFVRLSKRVQPKAAATTPG
ncbi:MAG: hypothetical protein ACK5X0_11630, partial [Rhodospirillales bacterium]